MKFTTQSTTVTTLEYSIDEIKEMVKRIASVDMDSPAWENAEVELVTRHQEDQYTGDSWTVFDGIRLRLIDKK